MIRISIIVSRLLMQSNFKLFSCFPPILLPSVFFYFLKTFYLLRRDTWFCHYGSSVNITLFTFIHRILFLYIFFPCYMIYHLSFLLLLLLFKMRLRICLIGRVRPSVHPYVCPQLFSNNEYGCF